MTSTDLYKVFRVTNDANIQSLWLVSDDGCQHLETIRGLFEQEGRLRRPWQYYCTEDPIFFDVNSPESLVSW
jgi:hypothetical protein